MSWPRYIITVTVVGLIYGTAQIIKALADTSGLEAVAEYAEDTSRLGEIMQKEHFYVVYPDLESSNTHSALTIDEVFNGIRLKMELVCIFFVIILNHRQIGRYTCLVEAFSAIRSAAAVATAAEDVVAYATPLPPLVHHTAVIVLYVSALLTIDVGATLGGDGLMEAVANENPVWVTLVWEFVRVLFYGYVIIFCEARYKAMYQ